VDPAPIKLNPQAGGVDVDNNTLFPLGTTEVAFRFQDASGNVGTAVAEVTVVLLLVDPAEGTVGTEITIWGEVFGTKKGKALLGEVALKVLEWRSSSIRAILTKAVPAANYPIKVQPVDKGVPPIIEAGAFTVRDPEIDTIDPGRGGKGTVVTLTGKFFGTKKGKVYLEKGGVAKSCKVSIWEVKNLATGESEVQFLVPKGLSPGKYNVWVENKVGSGILTEGFEVTAGP
jgi:hypothetical protein